MPARLLIVEDDPVVRQLVTGALNQYTTVSATSGEQALEMYRQLPFDAVICDIGLPGIDGFEVVQSIRRENPSARILIMSGEDRESKMIASLRESIVDYLAKPFEVADLRAAVANVLASEESIEVVSVTPRWIELRVPASFQMVARLGKYFEQLHAEIDQPTREGISVAFRELLNNAIEHGCEGDAQRRIGISYLRLSGVILYRITDPGRGFRMEELTHAAVTNPADDPIRHVQERMSRGLRAGGFGILFARGIADELLYNQRGNEVVFVRYLDNRGKPIPGGAGVPPVTKP